MDIWQPDTSTVRPSDFRPLDEDLVENSKFEAEDWSDLDQTGATFDTCELISPILDGVTWNRVRMVNSVIYRANCVQLDATESSWQRGRLENCRFGVLDLTDSSLKNIEFVGCKIDLLNLRGAKATSVLLRDCNINEFDATNAQASQFAFESSELEHLLVPNAQLSSFNLAGAELNKITGVSSLRGASINLFQLQQLAPVFAEEIGINILN